MTFRDIRLKMFKAEVKQYKVFILCNLFASAILLSFLSILKNPQFMDSSIVDPMISSNIYAPTYLVLIFSGFFIIYSQNIFLKYRQKDFGILITLGMTDREVAITILRENLMIYIICHIGGLLVGTLFSILFSLFIRNVIGIKSLSLILRYEPYGITIRFTFLIYLVSLLANILTIAKRSIIEKLKIADHSEGNHNKGRLLFFTGLFFFALSWIVQFLFFKQSSTIWLVSLFLCFGAIFLLYRWGGVIVGIIKRISNKFYNKHLFLLSDFVYYQKRNSRLFFINTIMLTVILFFLTFALATYPSFTQNAITYHPFHMAYTEVDGFFQPLSDDQIHKITHDYGNQLDYHGDVEFIRNGVFTVFCSDDVNSILHQNFRVEPNSYILLTPDDMKDGYERDIQADRFTLNIGSSSVPKEVKMQESVVNPLFGQVNSISDKIILLNRQDYNWILESNPDFGIKCKLQLYNFQSWQNSEDMVEEVKSTIYRKNPQADITGFYKISTRIDAYNTARQSSLFLVTLIVYLSLLFYLAIVITIHFNLQMEFEDEKNKHRILDRIGASEENIRNVIYKKVLSIFYIPLLVSTIMILFYGCFIGYGMIGLRFALVSAVTLMVIQYIYFKRYEKSFSRKIIASLRIN